MSDSVEKSKRPLGRTDVSLDRIAIGTWGLSEPVYGSIDLERSHAVLARAFAVGFRTFDVAPFWGSENAKHRSDTLLHDALGDAIEETTLIVRVGALRKGESIITAFDPDFIIREVEQSLQRLGRSRIDVLLLNHPSEKAIGHVPILKGITYLKSQNMVRAWGVASESLAIAQQSVELGAEVLAIPHNFVQTETLHEMAGLIKKRELGLITQSPLAHGFLLRETGSETPPEHHLGRRFDGAIRKQREERRSTIRALSADAGIDPLELALRFAFSSMLVTSVVAGPRTVEQLESLLASASWEALPRETLEAIDALAQKTTTSTL